MPSRVYVVFGCRESPPTSQPDEHGSLKEGEEEETHTKEWYKSKFGSGMPGHRLDKIAQIDLPNGFIVSGILPPKIRKINKKQQKE
jgi:hypothetical protein